MLGGGTIKEGGRRREELAERWWDLIEETLLTNWLVARALFTTLHVSKKKGVPENPPLPKLLPPRPPLPP